MFDFTMPPLDWRDAVLPKKSGGVRHIKIPNDQLMKVQRDILQYLYSLYFNKKLHVSSFAHGFIPFRNTSTGIIKHSLESEVFLCCDMKDFFDNFPVDAVREKQMEAGVNEHLTSKIITATTCDGHFPQGSPASPWQTNIGMLDCDLMIASYASKNGFVYTRYADDITLSLKPGIKVEKEPVKQKGESDEQVMIRNPYRKIFYGIETILKSHLGLCLKHRKDHVIWRHSRCKPVILGISLRQDDNGYNADKKLRANTRAAVHQLAIKVQKNHGAIYPEDKIKWMEILGSIRYMDYIRSFSKDGYNDADPKIQEKYYNYLEEKLGNKQPQEI